jgi:dTDP-4-dehydrorhamnose reductase
MKKPLIVVTGVNGQLGWSIQNIANNNLEFDFLFADRNLLDLSNPAAIPDFFKNYQPQYFINCAAYTAVDKAESEQELALTINATSVGEIAKQCAAINATLITISTDYVFDGNGTAPYTTIQATAPLNYYGYSKWLGEKLALENNPKTIVIRTSWVYCEHGNNFVKTMLRLMKDRTSLNVVCDQIGSPTYAPDLAKAILKVIIRLQNDQSNYGVYHYSNSGVISWYEFAAAIKALAGLSCEVNPIASAEYPTPAKRPFYSVMDISLIQQNFEVAITNWEESLRLCISNLKVATA